MGDSFGEAGPIHAGPCPVVQAKRQALEEFATQSYVFEHAAVLILELGSRANVLGDGIG